MNISPSSHYGNITTPPRSLTLGSENTHSAWVVPVNGHEINGPEILNKVREREVAFFGSTNFPNFAINCIPQELIGRDAPNPVDAVDGPAPSASEPGKTAEIAGCGGNRPARGGIAHGFAGSVAVSPDQAGRSDFGSASRTEIIRRAVRLFGAQVSA